MLAFIYKSLTQKPMYQGFISKIVQPSKDFSTVTLVLTISHSDECHFSAFIVILSLYIGLSSIFIKTPFVNLPFDISPLESSSSLVLSKTVTLYFFKDESNILTRKMELKKEHIDKEIEIRIAEKNYQLSKRKEEELNEQQELLEYYKNQIDLHCQNAS